MYYFIRHGETNLNALGIINAFDTPLNERGHIQVAEAAQFFKDKNIKKIYSSDTIRTLQSAEIINRVANLGLEIIPDARLCEVGLGKFEGNTKEHDIIPLYKDPIKHGIEPMESVYNRARSFLDSIKATEDIIIVCHGGIMHLFKYASIENEFNPKSLHKLFINNPTGYKNAEILITLQAGAPQ